MEEEMLRGFRDFVLRGNVVDLAIAVIIGAAFNAVVTSESAYRRYRRQAGLQRGGLACGRRRDQDRQFLQCACLILDRCVGRLFFHCGANLEDYGAIQPTGR
jgi:hypothetical protein